jgi:hypothetical protein
MAGLDWHLIHPDGDRGLWILATEEEIADYRAKSPFACNHPERELRDYPTSNGGWQRKEQCTVCGASLSQARQRGKGVSVPLWDLKLNDQWTLQCNAQRREIEARLIDRTATLETSGYAFYAEYLSSGEWLEKRARVLKRDGGLCQACLATSASEVHHHTYDHIFNEFMYELVSVCRTCHERLHSRKKASIEAARAKGLA